MGDFQSSVKARFDARDTYPESRTTLRLRFTPIESDQKLGIVMNALREVASKAKVNVISKIRNLRNMLVLEKMIGGHIGSGKSLKELFGHVSDEFWLWMYIEGYRKSLALRQLLPTLPEESLQLQFTGASGDSTLRQAFLAYKLFKSLAKQYDHEITGSARILDFGVGWGRIIRFFLKDVEVAGLYGIDCDPEIVSICKTSNLKANFDFINPYPPTQLANNSFDLVYSYSVFSHLSEELHIKWLIEFHRILKPGGLLIVTTRPREFILYCAKLREMADIQFYAEGAAASFQDTEQFLSDYDKGKYCFASTGGGGVRNSSFYGETCIPREYVKTQWTSHFSFVDFIEHTSHKSFDQNVIIVRR